jgi:outer membrane protein
METSSKRFIFNRLSNTLGLIGLATSLTTTLTTPQISHADTLSLSSTVEKILASQPRLKLEKEKLNQVDAQQRAILASALPSLSSSITWTRKEDALSSQFALFNGESYNAYAGAIEANVPIYTGGKVSAARRAARKDETLQKISIEKTERDLTIEGIRLFHRVLLAQRSLETVERLRDIQQKLLNTAQRRYQVGNESKLSVLQIKTELALLAPQITQGRNELSILASELADLAGMDDLKELSIKGRLGPWSFSLPIEKKAEARPEWRSLQLGLERVADERTVTLAKHFPQVSGFANLTRNGYEFSNLGDSDNTAWNAGIRITVPIFSGLESVYERRELRSREMQLEYQAQDMAKTLELNRVRAMQGFENARDVETASLIAFKQAQEAVAVAQKNYQIGTSDYQQVSETQKQLADADRSFARSQFQVLEAFTQCYVANGWNVSELPSTIEAALIIEKNNIEKSTDKGSDNRKVN